MTLWKRSVGVSRVDCSRVGLMVLDRRRRVDQRTWGEWMEDEAVEYRQTSGAGETEHKLDEIREIGKGLVVQWFKGENNNFVLNTGFHKKTVQSTKNRRYVVRPGRTTGEAGSIILKFIRFTAYTVGNACTAARRLFSRPFLLLCLLFFRLWLNKISCYFRLVVFRICF